MNSFADWQNDIDSWDKAHFISETSTYLHDMFDSYQDQHLIGMLAESIETYVACTKDIRLNGLVVVHKNGVTGKNHHVEIRDKALARSLQIMNELGLTPKTREKPEPKPSAEMIAFLLGPAAMPRVYGEGPPPLDSICGSVSSSRNTEKKVSGEVSYAEGHVV